MPYAICCPAAEEELETSSFNVSTYYYLKHIYGLHKICNNQRETKISNTYQVDTAVAEDITRISGEEVKD